MDSLEFGQINPLDIPMTVVARGTVCPPDPRPPTFESRSYCAWNDGTECGSIHHAAQIGFGYRLRANQTTEPSALLNHVRMAVTMGGNPNLSVLVHKACGLLGSSISGGYHLGRLRPPGRE